ncbi:MAG: four helix bundle protein [Rhodocyclales bacterium]|nr:four helix bundle protein [Rhodocyclales bacterium]
MRRKHHELQAWQLAIQLVKGIYQITASFPASEMYGLSAQMRRSAVSIPSNIAEGAARNTTKEFLHFLGIARGSLSELETQVVIARELGFIVDSESIEKLIDDAFGLLGGLINSLRAKEQ